MLYIHAKGITHAPDKTYCQPGSSQREMIGVFFFIQQKHLTRNNNLGNFGSTKHLHRRRRTN